MSSRHVRERITTFRRRFGEAHYWFACHAAFPLGLTAELLYLMRASFQLDEDGNPICVPWIAVSDLLLSEFCRPIGPETFAMSPDIQAAFVDSLQQAKRFGPKRLQHLNLFISTYYREALANPVNTHHAFARAQELTARWVTAARLQPAKVISEFEDLANTVNIHHVFPKAPEITDRRMTAAQQPPVPAVTEIPKSVEPSAVATSQRAILEIVYPRIEASFAGSAGQLDLIREILRPKSNPPRPASPPVTEEPPPLQPPVEGTAAPSLLDLAAEYDDVRLRMSSSVVRTRKGPKSLTQYRVFIGSPGGLDDERECFRTKLEKFSMRHAEDQGVLFQAVGWEDTLGGVGRPQALINEDLKQCDYAVFVLHNRWGSPTGGGYTSGTEEEWALAEDLYEDNIIRNIALFFKDVDPVQLRDPGPQLQSVLAFKKRIEEGKRYLFKQYSNVSQFAETLEGLLTRWLRDHKRTTTGLVSAGATTSDFDP